MYIGSKYEKQKEVWKCDTINDEQPTSRCVRRNFDGACGNYVVARQVTYSIDFLAGGVCVRNFDRKLILDPTAIKKYNVRNFDEQENVKLQTLFYNSTHYINKHFRKEAI